MDGREPKDKNSMKKDNQLAFRFSGSSDLPAYPGFIVMKYPMVGIMGIS